MASPAPGGGAAPPPASAAPSLPAADVTLTAVNIDFSPKDLTVPADEAVHDGVRQPGQRVPHDVVIKDASGTAVF